MEPDDRGRDVHPILCPGHAPLELSEGVSDRDGMGERVQNDEAAGPAFDGLIVADHADDVVRPDLGTHVPGPAEHGRRGQADSLPPDLDEPAVLELSEELTDVRVELGG